ncbi:DUF1232 domain-containing protein [Priestia filamentosa]|nr:hypothetical protein B1B01_14000 [Priestia filamentosa]RJS65110.1 DUF1232 domain-containing protein [Priestia filamentosa]SMF42798.1 Uncharacterized membrane protein YkvA, DUF1232 family [Priestia filamentosa]
MQFTYGREGEIMGIGKRMLTRYMSKAIPFVKNKKRSASLLTGVIHKVKKRSFKQSKEELTWLINMFRDWIKGDYPNIPKRTLLTVAGTLLYVLSPIDLVPDFLFLIGVLDDFAVISFAMKQIEKDINQYKAWFQSQKRPLELPEDTISSTK